MKKLNKTVILTITGIALPLGAAANTDLRGRILRSLF